LTKCIDVEKCDRGTKRGEVEVISEKGVSPPPPPPPPPPPSRPPGKERYIVNVVSDEQVLLVEPFSISIEIH